MKKLKLIILFFIFAFTANAQYNNEWISYNQKYFKFTVSQEGIYRIDSTTLAQYYNLSTLNPKNIQLFFGGKEQFLYIKGEADNKINTSDYLEFYLNPKTVNPDSVLYTHINYLPNPYQPLIPGATDPCAFITVNNNTNNKRFILETDTTWANYSPTNYFYSEKIFTSTNNYNAVIEYPYGISDPHYTQAEGWGYNIVKGIPFSTMFGNLNVYTLTPLTSTVTINYSGNSLEPSQFIDHQLQTSYSNVNNNTIILADTVFRGFQPVKKTFTISTSNIGNATNFGLTSVANASFSAFSNNTLLHYINFMYPQTLNLNNYNFAKLFIDDNTTTPKGYLFFTNVNTSASANMLFYDITNGKRITNAINGSTIKAIVPNSGARKLCILSSESNTIAITSLTVANQNNFFTNFKNPAATKPYVIIYHNDTKSGALAYKAYRQSVTGGSYNVIDANIDELYEQFSFGITKNPAAMRNFIRFLKDSLPTPPRYVFLIGKGIKNEDISSVAEPQNLIPVMGQSSSDNLLTSALTPSLGNFFSPEIPIGRIAALTNTQVTSYLAKVQQHETSPAAAWKKRALFFVGGDTPSLSGLLNSFMINYGKTIADTLFGADTLFFRKNTTAPIQLTVSDSVKGAISNGAALINFFGHGSDQGFDQAIDDPKEYNNTGRYPFIIANSCYSGNIFIYGRPSVSERFVFEDQKGSIGFLASANLGFVGTLNLYNIAFYKAISTTKYNQGIGDIIKETTIKNALVLDSFVRFTSLDMTLHGDPAVKITNGALPDYAIKNNDISFNTKTYPDSIGIKINISNLGRAVRDSFFVKVERYFPNGDSTIISKKIPAPFFKDSLKFFTPLDFNRGIGLNKFKVVVNNLNFIAETTTTNNATNGTVDLFISGGDIIPVYPYKYAIVPKTTSIVLKASTGDPFAPLTNYRFQFDTCDKFTAPIQTQVITSKGGVIQFTVNLPFADSTVYFWRVSRDSISPTISFLWRESSFQTISSKRGWAQAHFNQFKNDGYQFVNYTVAQRKFLFQNNKIGIVCRNAQYPYIDPNAINLIYNNAIIEHWGCAPNGWNIAVFDSVSGLPWQTVGINYPNGGPAINNNCICYDNQIFNTFSFGSAGSGDIDCSNPNWQTDLQNFLNTIPVNNYVLAYTLQNAQKSTYSSNLYKAFDAIGVNSIRTTADTVPYILFGKNGSPQLGQEVKGTLKYSTILLKDSLLTKWNKGYVASEIIGPGYKWNSLHWRVQSIDATLGDTTILKLVGIKNNGQIDTLQTFTQDSIDIYDLDTYAKATTYPYLKLIAFMKDNVHHTSPQLKRWQVLYDEAPECAINPLKGFASINDTLQEGDVVTFKFPIENIGIKNFDDSLVVTYWIEDNARNKHYLPQNLKRKPFLPGQIIIDTVKINSYQYTGNNILWIYVNPSSNSKYQKEQYQFNNIGRFPFKVNKDITNPLLDVTFDGVRILNGDIVSAKPNILITLKDENQFLALNDTSAFSVFIQAPNQAQKRIYFANDLHFTPANLPKNSCSITYNPTLLIDGKYTLLVQSKDRSKNNSGSQDYHIQFEINNSPTITNVLNYPNPFSTSTRFVFTLTGSEIPEVFTIQVMTITGKLVREITRAELGNLHIGRNISDYAWDGKDNYGDKLANGVYLYKIVTKLNGQNIDKAGTTADKFFIKDFGKMVLMR